MTDSLTAFGELSVAENTPMTGWTFAYLINPDMVRTIVTGEGSVTHNDNFAVLNTGASTNSTAKLETILPLRYITGQGAVSRFTAVFSDPKVGSKQIIGVGDEDDGFFVGFVDTEFVIIRRRDGTDYYYNIPHSWVTETDFTKGNVFQIQFQWLGFGQITFFMENSGTGQFNEIGTIEYAGTEAVTSIKNPSLPISAFVANSENNTSIVLKTPSAAGFCQGKVENPTPPHPFALPRTLSPAEKSVSTQENVVTLSSPTSWQTIANRIRCQIRNLSVSVDGTKPVIIRIIKNCTLGGTPSYTAYNANTSPVSYDVAGTTITGGTIVFSGVLQKLDAQTFNLDTWGISIGPGETLTISAESAASSDVQVAINWVDLF